MMKFLIVRFNAMGDVLLASALCDSIKASLPDSEIHLLCYTPSDELFSQHRAIDKVIGINQSERARPISFLRRSYQIAQADYDVIIDTQSTAKSGWVRLFSSGCRFRITRQKKRRGWAQDYAVTEPKKMDCGRRANKLEQRLSLLAPLQESGLPIQPLAKFHLMPSDQHSLCFRRRLSEQGVDFSRPVFVFCVSSKEAPKKWRRSYMRELIAYCRDQYQAQIVLYHGLPHEARDVDLICDELGSRNDVYRGPNIRSLSEVPALLSLCHLFIGNEGGPRHIAQAVGTPTVAICSPHADKQEWLPSDSPLHQAIEWREVVPADEIDAKFDYGSNKYFQLYNAIRPEHVKPIIDSVWAAVIEENSDEFESAECPMSGERLNVG